MPDLRPAELAHCRCSDWLISQALWAEMSIIELSRLFSILLISMLLEKFNCLLASDEVSARPTARPRSIPILHLLQLGHLNDDVWDDDA